MAPKETLEGLLDQLMRAALAASAAREAGEPLNAQIHYRTTVQLLEQAMDLLPQVDEAARAQYEPHVREFAAVASLLEANLKAGRRNLELNNSIYKSVIGLTDGLPSDFEGRTRNSYGAVLMYFAQWEAAATELQLARQCLQTQGQLAQWSLATCRLATAYWRLKRMSDAICVLREVTSVFNRYHSRSLTTHHLDAAILLARLLWRRGQYRQANEAIALATQRLQNQHILLNSPQYATLLRLTKAGGLLCYEVRSVFARRTLEL